LLLLERLQYSRAVNRSTNITNDIATKDIRIRACR